MPNKKSFVITALVTAALVSTSTVSAKCVPWCAEDTPGYEGATGSAKRAKELQEHYGKILADNTQAGVKELSGAWREAYKGLIPDETARKIINQNTLKAIGAYYGGLEGAVAGEALTRLYQAWEESIRDVKKAKDQGFPQWKIDFIAELGPPRYVGLVTASDKHKENAPSYHNKIEALYNKCVAKIEASTSEIDAKNFVWDFEDNITRIIRNQEVQGC